MKGLPWVGFLMKLGSLCGLTSVMLVMLLGQSRSFLLDVERSPATEIVFRLASAVFGRRGSRTCCCSGLCRSEPLSRPLRAWGILRASELSFAFVVVCIAVVIMRKKEPSLPRPFKTPWVPLVPWLGVLVNVGLMAALGADHMGGISDLDDPGTGDLFQL